MNLTTYKAIDDESLLSRIQTSSHVMYRC